MLTGCRFCRLSMTRSRGVLATAAMKGGGGSSGREAPSATRRSTAKKTDRVVNFHAHMLEPSLVPEGGEPTMKGRPGFAERLSDPRLQIADMDSLGIDRQVVSQSNVVQGVTWGDARADLNMHRRINDRLAEEWVGAYPDRFIGAFGLPTQDIDLAIAELERVVTTLGLQVLQISSCTSEGVYYGDRRLHPLWEAVSAFGVTVFIHPHGQANAPPLDEFALANSVGQSIEEAKAMSSIIYHGIFDKFDSVKIVVAHGGGFLPHYYGRIDRNVANFPASAANISRYPSEYLKAFYYDTCVYSPNVLAALIRNVGADRLVLGTDYPFGVADPIAELRATPDLSDSAVEDILRHTPASLLERVLQ